MPAIARDLDTLIAVAAIDPPSALNKARYLTERVLHELCTKHGVKWGSGEPTLENMIGPLLAKTVIPKDVAIHVRTIQSNASPGSHYQERPLAESHVSVATIALAELLDWHYRPTADDVQIEAPKLAIKFVSGKYCGAMIELPRSGSLRLGRSSDVELVLVEDMMSRVHAELTIRDEGARINIKDCGSTNGSYVNGRRVGAPRQLQVNDTVVVGTSIFKLVPASGAQKSLERAREESERGQATSARGWNGDLEEISVPNVIVIATTSRKSGVILLSRDGQDGRIWLDRGKIRGAVIDGDPDVLGRDAFVEMMLWTTGTFELSPLGLDDEVEGEISESTEDLIRHWQHTASH